MTATPCSRGARPPGSEQLQLVVVGDPATVRRPLEQLRFGPLTVYDDHGEPIR